MSLAENANAIGLDKLLSKVVDSFAANSKFFDKMTVFDNIKTLVKIFPDWVMLHKPQGTPMTFVKVNRSQDPKG